MTTSIAPRQDRTCALCGATESYAVEMNEHHWVPRSLGGTDVILLCIRCHNATEGDRPIKIGVTHDYVFALNHVGELIAQRWINPPVGFDEGLVVAELENGTHRLEEVSRYFKWFSNEAIPAAAEALYRLYGANWKARARLLHIAKMRAPWGDKVAVLSDLIRQFDMSERQAYREIAAIEAADKAGLNLASVANFPAEVLVQAAKAEDMNAALELWQARKLEGPYSTEQFGRDLRNGHTAETQVEFCHGACETCGSRRPHRKEDA